jgi:hypothetical protein
MVGATTQLDNPPDRIKQQVRRQRKRSGSFKPVKRLKSARLRPCASDAHALDVRIKALVRIAREIAHPRPETPGLPRTMVDLKLDAVIAEREGEYPTGVLTAELAYVYDLPENLVSEWLEEHGPELDGLYDEDDSTPAAHRQMDERDNPAAYREGGGRPYYRSGLADGRPKAQRDCAEVVDEMSGFTVERSREMVSAGKPRPHEHARRDEGMEQGLLNYFLASIVKRGEATVVGLAGTLRCSRSTMERRLTDGDWEPVPSFGPIPEEESSEKPEPSVFEDWSYVEP